MGLKLSQELLTPNIGKVDRLDCSGDHKPFYFCCWFSATLEASHLLFLCLRFSVCEMENCTLLPFLFSYLYRKNGQQFPHRTWNVLKSRTTTASSKRRIYAASGNGPSHAKEIEYLEKPGNDFSSFYLSSTFQVLRTVLYFIPPKQLWDGYY